MCLIAGGKLFLVEYQGMSWNGKNYVSGWVTLASTTHIYIYRGAAVGDAAFTLLTHSYC